RESEERFRQIAENIDDVFWMTEPGPIEKVLYVSPAFERVWGRQSSELLANPRVWLAAVHEKDRESVLETYEEFLQGMGDFDIEYRIARPDGSIRWIWDRAFAIRDRDGNIRRVAGLAQDITQRKADEQKKGQLYKEIKHFAYIVSHDLRAPLVNLRGFSRELEMAMSVLRPAVEKGLEQMPQENRREVQLALEEDVTESLEFIKSSIHKMDHLISAILKLSRLERTELDFERLDMNSLVNETLDTFAHEIEEKGIEVRVGVMPDTLADRTSMEQILGNLLGNAIKYLDPKRPGLVKIAGWPHGEENAFRVSDNGLGISESDVERIFEVFQRAGDRAVPGEGMGLAYVRTLVRRHQGRIWCESEPGTGSTFTFTICNHLLPGESDP
ncbi:ATP-binding protein, partial [Thermodesulfobacteriota bacterium]